MERRIVFGITCKNAAVTIGYVLKLLLMQEGDFNRIFVVVDGGSSDDTVNVVHDVLSKAEVKYVVDSGTFNIPEGRNRVLDLAMKQDPDYILFIDADVVTAHRNIVKSLLDLAEKLEDNAIFCIPYKALYFKSREDAEKFMDKLLSENQTDCQANRQCHLETTSWRGLGFTLIPRSARVIRFDEDTTFAEDCYYGFNLWKNGFKLYTLVCSEDMAYDVNLRHRSNIYFSMSLRDYLRGARKKVAMQVYNIFNPSFLRFLKNFIVSRGGIRCLYSPFYTALMILGIIMNIPILVWIGFSLILLSIMLLFKKSKNPIKVLIGFVKFYIYSIAVVALLIPTYFKYRREFAKIYQMLSLEAEKWIR